MERPDARIEPSSSAGHASNQALGASTPALAAGKARAPQIPSLDGIRAVSFSIVFLAHAGFSEVIPGYFGLTLFFFLSGYLITTLLRIEFDRTSNISLRDFYARRVLRIFPPFYLILAVATLLSLSGFLGGEVTLAGVTAQALHFTNYWVVANGWWVGMAPGTSVYWSLAVEEHFYLVFPLLYLVLRRHMASRGRQALLLLGLCALVLAWRCLLVYGLDAPRDRTYVATDTRVDSILAGCVLAVWQNPWLERESRDQRRLARWWLPLGVSSVLASLLIREPHFEQSFRYTLQSLGLIPLFSAAILWHDRGPFRLLNLRPVRYLGVLSYSLYLMHTSVLWALQQRAGLTTALRALPAFAILLVLGTLIHRFVEAPCAKLRRRLGHVGSGAPV